MTIRRVAVNTGGGDAPGLNAVIRAVVHAGLRQGWEVFGIRHGYRGLVEGADPDDLVPLDRRAVRGITALGGSILGTANRGDPFKFPTRVGDSLVPRDRSEEVVECFRKQGFDALIAMGGDGSMRIAHKLLQKGLPRVIGVPKTIDNDLLATDATFGFDTAVNIATEAIERLHTTADAHERVMVVELMGRNAGFIALHAGVAGTADVVLIPEIPYDVDRVCEKVLEREARGRHFSIVVAAEGAREKGGEAVSRPGDVFRGVEVLGGIAERVARQIAERTGKETRALVLGHLQRGGAPSTSDRLLALRFGSAAVRFLAETDRDGMVALTNGQMRLAPFDQVTGGTKVVPVDTSDVVQTARSLGICFGDEPGGTFLQGRQPAMPLKV